MIEIREFERDMAAGVARCYSEVVAPAPHCEPVTEDWFSQPERLAQGPLREESLLVALADDGEVAGFVHVGVAPPPKDEWQLKGEPGVIRFLAYRSGERPVGSALLEAAEAWARERGRKEIVAGHCNHTYPFYHLPFSHISERISHLPPLFGMAGYAVCESEVFFSWENFEPPDVPAPGLGVELVPEWRDQVDTFGEGLIVYPRRGGKNLGECKIVLLGSDRRRPELKGWCFCIHLYLDEPLQGKGLGKHLLARGLVEMHARGLRHAMISTDWNNHRAYLFYTNFGFGFVDRTFAFRKELTG